MAQTDTYQPKWGEEAYPIPGVHALFDDTHALMSQAVFDRLPEYSCSVPTGVVPGKTWKRARDYCDRTKGWVIGRYDPHDERTCRTRWRELIIEGASPCLTPP